MNTSKKISSLENEIESIKERITGNNLAIDQTKTLLQQLETELREVRVASCLEPSSESKSIIADIKNRMDQAKNDLDEFDILRDALAGRKNKLSAEMESLQQQAKQDEAKRLSDHLPALILQYNEGMDLAFQASVAAKALIKKVMELGGKQFVHEVDARGFDKVNAMGEIFPFAEFSKDGCTYPIVLNINTCDKKSIINALLS